MNASIQVRRRTKPGFGRIVRDAIAVTACWSIALQPLLVTAGGIVADNLAAESSRPQIEAAGNGVPLVNIAAPNASGLSHNKYSQFNVGAPGAILNNSNQDLLRSELGGLVYGNPNLLDSGAAHVILNEISSTHPSTLEGAIEVHGTAADVIIANPNGLSCDGCGFINTPRATLSTGSAELGADGSLAQLRVDDGQILIGANGADMADVDVFNLISRTISVGGSVVTGGDLNVIAGRNEYAYGTGLVTPLEAGGDGPEIAIDSSLLGGMYAGRIRIVSSEAGAGVQMRGPMVANAHGMTLTSDGRLVVGDARGVEAIEANSSGSTVEVEGTLYSDSAVALEGSAGVTLRDESLVAAGGDVTLSGAVVDVGAGAFVATGVDTSGVQSETGILTVEADTFTAGNGQLAAGSKLEVTAATINVARDSDTGKETLQSLGEIVLDTDEITATNGRISSRGDLNIFSDDALGISGGTFATNSELGVDGASITSSAELQAGDTVTLRSRTADVVNSGRLYGEIGTHIEAAAGVDNTGQVLSGGIVRVNAGSTLENRSGGQIIGAEGVVLTAHSITNAGLINGGAGLAIQANDLTNAGSIGSSGGAIDVELSADLVNTGLFYSNAFSYFKLDGSFTNTEADVIAETDLVIVGLSGARAAAVTNTSGTIEAVSGNAAIVAESFLNERALLTIEQESDEPVVTNTGWYKASNYRRSYQHKIKVVTTTTTTRDVITQSSPAAKLLAGGDIVIATGTLTNSYSQIAANGDITIEAEFANNIGLDLVETTEFDQIEYHWLKRCKRNGSVFGKCHSWRKPIDWDIEEPTEISSETIDAVYGTIEAGGALSATVAGYLGNNAVRDGADQISLSSGAHALEDAGAVANSTLPLPVLDAYLDSLLGRTALFDVHLSPDMPYLIETRPDFIDPGRFIGSDYFLNRIDDFNPEETMKRVGDAYVETRLVQDQVFEMTGSRYLGDARDERSQMKALFDNALAEQQNLDLSVGVALTPHQIAALTLDIVWLEPQTVAGQQVLVPRLYLSSMTRDNVDLASGQIRGGQTSVEAAFVFNSGGIQGTDGLKIRTTNELLNYGGSLVSNADIVIDAGERFSNVSGIVSGDNIAIGAKDIYNVTATTRDGNDNRLTDQDRDQRSMTTALMRIGINSANATARDGDENRFQGIARIAKNAGIAVATTRDGDENQGIARIGTKIAIAAAAAMARDRDENRFTDRLQSIARIEARGTLDLDASGSIFSTGSVLQSGGDMTLNAGRDIELTAVERHRFREVYFSGGYDRSSALLNTLSSVQSGGDLTINAGEKVTLRGVNVDAGGDIDLSAGSDVTIESVQDHRNDDFKYELKGSGLFGVSFNVRDQQVVSETQRTSIKSGGELTIESDTGGITIDAADLTSEGAIELNAASGQVALLSNTDTIYEQDFIRVEDWLWWEEEAKGRHRETIEHVKIEAGGGLTINAGNGIVVEYHKTKSFDASLEQLSQSPGLSWIDELRSDPDVDWVSVDAAFNKWDYKEQGLSQAGAALLSLAVGTMTSGMISGYAGNLAQRFGFVQGGAMQTAIQSGLSMLTQQAAVALVNNQGDIGAALKELGSSAFLKSLATSMITSGLTSHFTKAAGIGEDLAKTAPWSDLSERVAQDLHRALIRASVSAGVSTAIQGGKLGENFVNALRSEAASVIGENAAEKIGAAYSDAIADGRSPGEYISHKVMHAALGCVTGSIGSDDCSSGAIGGFTGAVASEAYKDKYLNEELRSLNDELDLLIDKGMKEELAKEILQAKFEEWRQRGVDLSKLAAGLMAAAAGCDVDVAAETGGNAADKNVLPLIIVLVKIGLAAYTAYELLQVGEKAINLYQRIASGEEIPPDELEKIVIELGLGVAASVTKARLLNSLAKIANTAGFRRNAEEIYRYARDAVLTDTATSIAFAQTVSEKLDPSPDEKDSDTVVIGHYPDYVNKSYFIGAHRFDIPPDIWAKMTPDERSRANLNYIKLKADRRETFSFSNPPDLASEESSFYKELRYLEDIGYYYNKDKSRMLPPEI